MEQQNRGIMTILVALLILSLVATGLAMGQAVNLRQRMSAAETALEGTNGRLELAEKSLQSMKAEQDRLVAQLEQHTLAMESLEKSLAQLHERVGALEETLRQHQDGHAAPQLG